MIDGQNVANATQTSCARRLRSFSKSPSCFTAALRRTSRTRAPEASQAQIERAARLANAHEFIVRLPRGYQTLVGERGVKLSGGERQRVALGAGLPGGCADPHSR